jgi:hypothetical protein
MIFESGSNLNAIPERTFLNCEGLKSLCIPASVEVLGEACFSCMTQLSSLTFEPGSKLRTMEDQVFGRCQSLKSIVLPASVLIVDGSPFMHSCFEEITVEAGNTTCFSSSDSLIASNRTTLIRHFGLTEHALVSREYDTLGSFSFAGCPVMSTVSFEDDLKITRIDKGAFSECSALTSICIPSAVEILGEACLSHSPTLSQVTFESGSQLAEIGLRAFSKCSSLKSICIPAGVKFIPEHCFSECRSLTTVSFEPGSKLTRFDGHAFHGCNSLCYIEIPSQVEILQASTFQGCYSLPCFTIELPSHLRQFELPWHRADILVIPDSVEIVTGLIPYTPTSRSLLLFGQESRLMQVTFTRSSAKRDFPPDRKLRCRLFVSLSEAALRRFRLKLEVG